MAKKPFVENMRGRFDPLDTCPNLPTQVSIGDEFYGSEGTPFQDVLFRVVKNGGTDIPAGFNAIDKNAKNLAGTAAGASAINSNRVDITVSGVEANEFVGGKLIAGNNVYTIARNTATTNGVVDIGLTTPLRASIVNSANLQIISTGLWGVGRGARSVQPCAGFTTGIAVPATDYFAVAINGLMPVRLTGVGGAITAGAANVSLSQTANGAVNITPDNGSEVVAIVSPSEAVANDGNETVLADIRLA